MLEGTEPIPTVAVKDLKAAEQFYGERLGLELEDEEPGVATYKVGRSSLLVYESQFARTNRATAVTWTVGDDLERTVKELKSRGIVFEHYDLPGGKREGDIHILGESKAAWFKDPDQNIHSLVGH